MTNEPLDHEKVIALAHRMRQGDAKARDRLITGFDGLVKKIIRDEFRNFIGRYGEDLLQEGRLGLLHAVDRYDPDLGVFLATYAFYWIRAMIGQFLTKNRSIIMTPRGGKRQEILRKFGKVADDPDTLEGPGKSADEKLAEQFDEDLDEVRILRVASKESSLVSIDTGGFDDEGLELPDCSTMPDMDHIDQERQVECVQKAIRMMPKRERDIISRRYLTDEPETLKDLGVELGISRERVRQIEEKTLGKLRERLKPLRDGV